jgi:hypothetical protein
LDLEDSANQVDDAPGPTDRGADKRNRLVFEDGRVRDSEGNLMHLLPHSLVKGALLLLGLFVGSIGGGALLRSGLLKFLGDNAGGILPVSAMATALVAVYTWQWKVPILCSACEGPMKRMYLGNRRFAYDCEVCGQREVAF